MVAAQANTWEALLVYLAALFATSVTAVDPESLVTPALIFVLCRFLHTTFYILNKGTLRSLSFAVGYGAGMYLFYLALSVG